MRILSQLATSGFRFNDSTGDGPLPLEWAQDRVSQDPRGSPCNNLPSLVGKTREQRCGCYGATNKGRKGTKPVSQHELISGQSIARIKFPASCGASLRSEYGHAPQLSVFVYLLGFKSARILCIEYSCIGDPEGKDLPVESSAFDRVDFDISDLGNGLEAIDIFNLADVLLNPFKMLSSVAPSSCEEWASVYASVTKRFIQACELPSNDPQRRSQILRSLKWYSVITQVIFRKPNRDKDRSVKVVNFRLR